MLILFDQGTPVPIRKHLANHTIFSAFERGWSELENGELLAAAETEGFHLLVTTDQNLRYQQNFSDRTISIVVLPTTNWPVIRRNISIVAETIDAIQPGSYQELSFPDSRHRIK